MSFSKNDVLLLPIPFTDLSSRKVRPAVVVGISAYPDDLFVVPISSQMLNLDLPIEDWREAGLNVRCGIKSQIATIESRLVLKRVGTLTHRDQTALEARLRFWLQL
jgi:mRNA interferase MazF